MNLHVELDKINLRIEETQKEIGVAQDALIDVDEGKTKEKAKAAAKLARLNVQLDDLKARLALYDKSITSAPQQASLYNQAFYLFNGKITSSKAVKGVRTGMYKNAQTYCGYYHPSIPAFNYNEKDPTLCIVFKTEVNALNFQTEFEFLGTNIFHSQLKTESEVTLIDKIILGERIFLKDYESYEFGGPPEGSPDDSFLSESSSVYTEYSPTDDFVKYQSLEKINWLEFGSEGAHLVFKKTCLKRKNDSLNRSENNRLALSRQLHGFVDGLSNGRRPVVKLNYVPGKEEKVGLRYRVTVGVQFLSQRVRALVEPLLNEGSRSTANPLVMECDVYVLDKDEFIESLIHKSNETNGIWNVLGY